MWRSGEVGVWPERNSLDVGHPNEGREDAQQVMGFEADPASISVVL